MVQLDGLKRSFENSSVTLSIPSSTSIPQASQTSIRCRGLRKAVAEGLPASEQNRGVVSREFPTLIALVQFPDSALPTDFVSRRLSRFAQQTLERSE